MANEKDLARKAEDELNENRQSGLGARMKGVQFGQPAEGAAPGGKPLAEYTVQPGDTLGSIALKYYGSASREAWMVIYEANKVAIGDNPGIIHPGIVLVIPEK